MSVKLYNKKTGHTAACERADWTACRDHNVSKGWTVFTPEHLNTPERKAYLKAIDNVIDTSITNDTVTVDAYNNVTSIVDKNIMDDPRLYSEDYNTRAAALRDKVTQSIREQGLGSNFEVANINSDDDNEWTGNCTSCGARVSNFGSKGWEHTAGADEGYQLKIAGLCPAELNK